jgi:hypothetical protein
MLATRNTPNHNFIATRIPGTSCIIIVNRKQNLAQLGFQFERYAIGKPSNDTTDTTTTDHIQTMQIGPKTVLFIAEVDAVDEDSCPVEIKTSDPSNWGLKVMFQMISNGSSKLCQGERDGWAVKNITLKSLSDVAKFSLQRHPSDISTLQKNILHGMDNIASLVTDLALYRLVCDDKTMKVELVPNDDLLQCALLPPNNIVENLINWNCDVSTARSLKRNRGLTEI